MLFPCNTNTDLYVLFFYMGTIIVPFHSSGLSSAYQICLTSSYILFNSLIPLYFINSGRIHSGPANLLFFKFLIVILHLL